MKIKRESEEVETELEKALREAKGDNSKDRTLIDKAANLF